jgi:RNA polymerase sigma-70 factor (ECF subfamily)
MTSIEFHNQLLNLERSLKKFAYCLTSKQSAANDLVQETFLKVLLNRDKFIINENFKAWAFTIMRNTFINNYRRNSKKYIFYEEIKDSHYRHFNKHHDPNSAYSVIEITQIIEKLRAIYRVPMEMHIEGFKYKEIADLLGINIGTVKSRIFLSRKQLMDQLNA